MTGNFTSIARPYAMAAFEYALAKNALPAWEVFLKNAAMIARNSSALQVMMNPEIKRSQVAALFSDILGSQLSVEQNHFLRLLAEHHRFAVLPEIAEQFILHRAEQEKKVTAHVTSANPLDAEQQAQLAQALTKRLQRQVTLDCKVDPDLLGGVTIRVGDKVIDGSVRGKLHRLVEFI